MTGSLLGRRIGLYAIQPRLPTRSSMQQGGAECVHQPIRATRSFGRSGLCFMNFNPLATALTNPAPLADQGWITEERWFDAQDVKAQHVL
jgi:hypothetical protein